MPHLPPSLSRTVCYLPIRVRPLHCRCVQATAQGISPAFQHQVSGVRCCLHVSVEVAKQRLCLERLQNKGFKQRLQNKGCLARLQSHINSLRNQCGSGCNYHQFSACSCTSTDCKRRLCHLSSCSSHATCHLSSCHTQHCALGCTC